MVERTFIHNNFTFKRISRARALRAYKNGLTVLIAPVNIHPFGLMWHCDINRKRREEFLTDETSVINDFNNLINSHDFYNCINSETGKYTAFYIPVETIDGREQYNYKYMEG